MDVYVTGSNSSFLSSDVLTEFAGKGDKVHVLPLSFSEFYTNYNNEPEYALDDYMIYGGLPAVSLMKTPEQKASYLKMQLQNVYLKDIVEINHLNSDENIGELFDIIASGIFFLTNPTEPGNIFKSITKTSLSALTINRYITYMQEMLSKAKRYDVKEKKYIGSPYKIYFEDVGLQNAQLDFRQKNHLMENIIYNERRYRGYNVDVGVVDTRENINGSSERRQLEIDFVANQGSKRYYIQSAYDITNEDKMKQKNEIIR